MSIAQQISPTLASRQARAAALAAERAGRDAFIEAQFAALGTRFDGLLREALGVDSRLQVTVQPLVYAVQGRSFTTLSVDTWAARATFNGTPQTVSFTPRLDFRQPDQFGLIECALDFDYAPARSFGDRCAQSLLRNGIVMRGKSHGSLLVSIDGLSIDLRASELEAAFRGWWLR
jgi:hypothetical protein